MDERERILRLLEEGKISAEEAIRLLELLGKKKEEHFFSDIFEGIPEAISEIFIRIGDSLKRHFETLFLSQREKIVIESVAGDIQIFGKDTLETKIERTGWARINTEKEYLKISSLKGELKIETNYHTEIKISTLSGKVSIFRIKKAIDFEAVSGKILGKDVSGKIKGETISGDIEMEIDDFSEIDLTTQKGNITLELKEDTVAEIEFYGKRENITCEFPWQIIKEEENYLKGIINQPGNPIRIRNESGKVKIRKR